MFSSQHDIRYNGTAPQSKINQFKLVLLGEAAVGKSSLVLRFVKKSYQHNQEGTVGCALMTQTVYIDDSAVKFDIWDTAGSERFHCLAAMYYRNAEAAIVVYDIQNKSSFTRARLWVEELRRQASPNIVIALAGNKNDLSCNRAVSFEEGKEYAEKQKLLFVETSAKTAVNVEELFLEIAKRVLKNLRCIPDPTCLQPHARTENIRLTPTRAPTELRQSDSRCCNIRDFRAHLTRN